MLPYLRVGSRLPASDEFGRRPVAAAMRKESSAPVLQYALQPKLVPGDETLSIVPLRQHDIKNA